MTDFQRIYEEQGRKVYRYLLCLTGSEDAAEELLAETFYQAIVHIGQFRGDCSILTWLCAIGNNLWKKETRRRRRFSSLPDNSNEHADPSPSPEDALIGRDEAARIFKAAAALPEQMRMVFLLRTLGELPLKEIAGICQKSESWARVTYYRAKQKIAEEVLK